ncbi:MAG: N-acetyl sugar amidotransferase, partial [Georgfuchsia sp.]
MTSEVKNLRWCSHCLAMSTRPRITFDERGWCNACRWMEEKKTLNWDARQKELDKLLDKHRDTGGSFDCLVPVSGGKDGSYVAYNLKHKYGMNPLCLTVTPALPLQLGEQNLRAFVESGYNHISVNPAHEAMRVLNRVGLVEMGFPYYGWLTAIQAAPVRIANQLGIGLIFYGEDGEVEYGGTTETGKNPIYDVHYMKKIYLEDGYDKVLQGSGVPEQDLFFFRFPSDADLVRSSIEITHWSYFENWDPYRNYLIAKERCGLKEAEGSNSGTFTNFSQNDQALYALHTYLMYLKFGFGRATQDASIEVRRGAMDRDQAVNLVRIYDGHYPHEYI